MDWLEKSVSSLSVLIKLQILSCSAAFALDCSECMLEIASNWQGKFSTQASQGYGCCIQGDDALDLSGLPAAARRVELKRARERAEMRRVQRVWAERGAAALAAAGDMPGTLSRDLL